MKKYKIIFANIGGNTVMTSIEVQAAEMIFSEEQGVIKFYNSTSINQDRKLIAVTPKENTVVEIE